MKLSKNKIAFILAVPLLILVVIYPLVISKKQDLIRFSDQSNLIMDGKIAFSTNRNNSNFSLGIYQNGDIQFLPYPASHPKWSPSGKKILFGYYQGFAIYDFDANEFKEYKNIFNSTGSREWFSVEKQILIIGNKVGVFAKVPDNIYLFDLETNEWKQITHLKGKETLVSVSPFNDKKRILTSLSNHSNEGLEAGVYILNIEDGSLEKVGGGIGQVDLMPDNKSYIINKPIYDGKKLISPDELFLVDLETGKEIQLTNTKGMKSAPTISPDGKYVLYSVINPKLRTDRIYRVNIKTKELSEIFNLKKTSNGEYAFERNPDWHI